METLSEHFKPVILESYDFQKRKIKNNNWTVSHVRPINTPISRTQSKIVSSKSQLKLYHRRFRPR